MNPAEFDNIAVAEQQMWWFRGMREILNCLLQGEPRAETSRRVMEGGCGTGFNTLALGERFGWQMFPVDLSPVGLAHAVRLGVKRAVCADIAGLPFPEATFDAVVSLDVLAHFRPGDEIRPLREFARVIRPGGLLVLRTSALDILRSRHSEFVQERQRFTASRLESAVSASGFRVLRMTYANTLLLPVALFRFRLWEPLFGGVPESGVKLSAPWIERLLSIPMQLEAAWISRGRNLPVGQSLLVLAERSQR